MRILIVGAATLLASSGCMMGARDLPQTASEITGATAELRNAGGVTVGTATAAPTGDGLRINLTTTNLPAGVHAVHVHAVGSCTPPGFESAGPHWNPAGRQHGTENPAGPHKGDLPNMTVAADGRGSLSFEIPAAMLTGGTAAMLDGDGAAVVVHASGDDYRTDPSGNSGGRIACGVFR